MMRGAKVVALCLVPWLAWAQKAPTGSKPARARLGTRADLAELRARVEEVQKVIADMPALRAHLRDIETLLLRVQAQMDRIEDAGAPGRDEDARRELDRIRDRVTDLRERVARLEFEARLRREAGFDVEPQGPVVRSADGAFALQLGGRLKLRLDYVSPEVGDEEVGFQLRQAKAVLAGHLFVPTLQYRFQTEFGRGKTELQDYYVDYARFAPWLTLRFGQFRVPFTRQRPVSAAGLQFTDRSAAVESFELDRDIGLQAFGGLFDDKIQWWVAALNGNGPNTIGNDSQDLLWAARILLSPWGPAPMTEGDVVGQETAKVGIGGSVAYTIRPTDILVRDPDAVEGVDDDQDQDGRMDAVKQSTAGLEVVGHWLGASIQFEYLVRREDAGAVRLFDTGGMKEYDGMYVQAGYFIVPAHFEAAVRGGFAEPHGYGLEAAERALLPDQINEYAVVLSYLRYGHHLKLQAEYAYLESQVRVPASEVVEHRARLQLQVDF